MKISKKLYFTSACAIGGYYIHGNSQELVPSEIAHSCICAFTHSYRPIKGQKKVFVLLLICAPVCGNIPRYLHLLITKRYTLTMAIEKSMYALATMHSYRSLSQIFEDAMEMSRKQNVVIIIALADITAALSAVANLNALKRQISCFCSGAASISLTCPAPSLARQWCFALAAIRFMRIIF